VTGPFVIDDPDGSVQEARWFPRAEAVELLRQVPYPPIAITAVAYLTGVVGAVTTWVFTLPVDAADGEWIWTCEPQMT
jgi:8-oxo-dGTP diphosphatase